MAGRKRDHIWMHYTLVEGDALSIPPASAKAQCNLCKYTLAPLVARMKVHHEKCKKKYPENQNGEDLMISPEQDSTTSKQPPAKMAKQSNLSKFVVITTKQDKEEFDEQCAKMVYSGNLPFSFVERPEFIKFCEKLRPGYKPPDRKQIGNQLLDKVYDDLQTQCALFLKNEPVCMAIDGWSNIKRDPIVCATVTKDDGNVILVETINTEGEPHTSDNLLKIANMSKNNAEKKYSCFVKSFVSDDAANMKRKRKDLENDNDGDSFGIISYGCSAHGLNLLAHDFINSDTNKSKVIGEITLVLKYFRNHKLPSSWYKSAGGKELVMPIDVRWNSNCDALASYVDNWVALAAVCEKYRLDESLDWNISKCGYFSILIIL